MGARPGILGSTGLALTVHSTVRAYEFPGRSRFVFDYSVFTKLVGLLTLLLLVTNCAVMEEVNLYQKFIDVGKSLQLTGQDLIEYVDRRVEDTVTREERAVEIATRMREQEMIEQEKQRKHELEMAKTRIEGSVSGHGAINKTLIKLTPYKDEEDVDVI
jgi:hypothetical protein